MYIDNVESVCNVSDNNNNFELNDSLNNRNRIDIKGLASASIRYGTSSRVAGAMATACLGDLIKAGILPPDAAYLSVDGAKFQRAKSKMIENATIAGNHKTDNDIIRCIMFDSRIDKKSKVRYFDEETQKFYPRLADEDHYTITDGEGRYLHFFTKPGKKDTFESNESAGYQRNGKAKPSEIVADMIIDWMKEHGVDLTLTHIAGDSTASNTGLKQGRFQRGHTQVYILHSVPVF